MHKNSARFLLVVVIVNYLAQVPYYLHQYYFPHHLPPSVPGIILLAITLVWFLVGYIRYQSHKPYGRALLLSFLTTQVLFYGHSLLLGLFTGEGIVAQLRTPSHFLLVIFLIGDANFVVAIYYLLKLIQRKKASPEHES